MEPDHSTFDLRWAEAKRRAADFRRTGATVDHSDDGILEDESEQCDLLHILEPTGFSDPEEGITLLDIGADDSFLSLEKKGKYLLIRPFYEVLYDRIFQAWSSKGTDRVLVKGNAGTGKSWFQLYALRRLLRGYGTDHEYLFVIRQVKETLYLIDLSNGEVRYLNVEKEIRDPCLDKLRRNRVLYFSSP